MSDSKDNEVIVMLHGKEVLKLDQNEDVSFDGNFIHNDLEANKRFIKFFQNNLTLIIEGEKAAEDEKNISSACGSCAGC